METDNLRRMSLVTSRRRQIQEALEKNKSKENFTSAATITNSSVVKARIISNPVLKAVFKRREEPRATSSKGITYLASQKNSIEATEEEEEKTTEAFAVSMAVLDNSDNLAAEDRAILRRTSEIKDNYLCKELLKEMCDMNCNFEIPLFKMKRMLTKTVSEWAAMKVKKTDSRMEVLEIQSYYQISMNIEESLMKLFYVREFLSRFSKSLFRNTRSKIFKERRELMDLAFTRIHPTLRARVMEKMPTLLQISSSALKRVIEEPIVNLMTTFERYNQMMGEFMYVMSQSIVRTINLAFRVAIEVIARKSLMLM